MLRCRQAEYKEIQDINTKRLKDAQFCMRQTEIARQDAEKTLQLAERNLQLAEQEVERRREECDVAEARRDEETRNCKKSESSYNTVNEKVKEGVQTMCELEARVCQHVSALNVLRTLGDGD